MVITTTMANFDVLRILIDKEGLCNIMYADLFEKLGLRKENMSPYIGSHIQYFNDNDQSLGFCRTHGHLRGGNGCPKIRSTVFGAPM